MRERAIARRFGFVPVVADRCMIFWIPSPSMNEWRDAMRQCAVGVEAARSMEEARGRGVGARVTRGRCAGGRFVTMTTMVMTTLMTLTRASTTMAVVRAREMGDDPSSDGKSVHTVFSTECTAYFDWQSLGLYDSWRRVGQRGKFTRLDGVRRRASEGFGHRSGHARASELRHASGE